MLALLLLFVLIASAAEVRRQEVALAKLRGFSARKVVRFAVAEPAAVLLSTIPVGIGLAVLLERTIARTWLGSTPFVVTPQAVVSAVVVTVGRTGWRRSWPCSASCASRWRPRWRR